METDEERRGRLENDAATKRLRLAMKMGVESKARLEKNIATTQLRLALETEEERRARLEHLSDNQHLRLAAETNSERAARLEHQSANHHLRLAVETDDEREARMQWVAALMQQRRDLDERLPLHEQHHVQAAMHSFHAEMSSVQIHTCYTCMETFPGIVTGVSPNCIPLSNNMHPGAGPTELQVRL